MEKTKHILIAALFVILTTVAYSQSGKYFIHTVKKGDTLYSLSNTYEVTQDEIIKVNPGSDKKLTIGQKLKIPQKKQETVSKENGNYQYHTIQPEETLYRLAKRYNVTIQAICDANQGLSHNNFKAGEVIRIPVQNKPVTNLEKATSTAKPETESGKTKEYTVKRGDTVESICNEFNITQEEFYAANPELKKKNKLKKKMVVKIPAHKKKENAIKQENDKSNEEAFKLYELYKDSIKQNNKSNKNNGITKIGVVLSFLLDSYAPSEQSRIIEYYQGFLIAVDRLKKEGYSFEINTFDSGHKEKSLDSLFASGCLNDMDLIIGATYTKHNKQLADFAKKREIPLVIPFTSKEKSLYQNPMVYIVNSIQSYVIPDVASQFVKSFPNANVIFVEDTIAGDKKEFITELKETLDKNNMAHTTIAMSSFLNEEGAIPTLKELRAEGMDNIIIPTSSSSATLNTILPILVGSKYIDSTSVTGYKLFGYPEWQIHAKETNGKMYEIDTYFYASFYSHYSLPEVSTFQNEFVYWYNRSIQNIYPRYAMLGYDTGYFFLRAIAMYGNELAEKINEVEFYPLQRGFKFERVNNWGGMVNKKFYFIHYNPKYYIERIDFDQ